ncbi:uncharacterized protein BO95DRAFT_495484 [Aspergillus brunneoviolaceus CBS 621.78]|uniref:Uncharacterized protein n=1 Tax=Aspergillus brunneoviolaceus CBS 621.78 TaxID=1450534 RepID=A0ACD1GAB3_9EURO|nr:hypothetical protein BO95DRAFT_495484 [Aspergillus brunneoviolaceus CBS 621.78]RAH46150.1 hypothetical protein BO95DRAFT_495484 [Aspergillus brunneoviolaceus CBS 621.78]
MLETTGSIFSIPFEIHPVGRMASCKKKGLSSRPNSFMNLPFRFKVTVEYYPAPRATAIFQLHPIDTVVTMESLRDLNPTAADIAAMAAHTLDNSGPIPYLLWGRLAVRLAGGRDLNRHPHLPDDECCFIVDKADLWRAFQVLGSGGFFQCMPRPDCRYLLGTPGVRLRFDAHLHTSARNGHDTCLLLYNKSRIIPDVNGAMIPGLLGPPGPLVPYMLSSDPNIVPPRHEDRGSGTHAEAERADRGAAGLPAPDVWGSAGSPGGPDSRRVDHSARADDRTGLSPNDDAATHLRALWRACNSRVIEEGWRPTFLMQLVSRNYEYIWSLDAEEENDDDVARSAHFMASRTQFVNDTRWQ